jgi:hypothetical protein
MAIRLCLAAAVLGLLAPRGAAADNDRKISPEYQALKYPLPPSPGTWAVLDFDGARRQVEPYLSSLGFGEAGTGVVVSPEFAVSVEAITFTVCGHDGHGGGREKNFVALVDAATGRTLEKTFAPGSDPMQERSWDVSRLQGRKVRIEVHDGIAEGAYAWLGVGRIDASPALNVDFRKGLPDDWKVTTPGEEPRTELVRGGIPFLRRAGAYTMIPREGAIEIPCGFAAERLFLLGCTVAGGKPLETYGHVEIVYRDGPPERYPLMLGFTLDGDGKLPSPSKAIHLHRSGDRFQYYLVLGCRSGVIDKVRLQRNPQNDLLPRITAITCQTQAAADNLVPVTDCRPGAEEAAWIRSHAISPDSPNRNDVMAEIRRAHKMH